MGTRAPRYTIILAAGEGTRMGSSTQHKVCFPIDGQPAVNRAIKIYNECGIAQLAGAGLGGCMMVLAHRDAVSNLVANLKQHYYQPQAKAPTILVCRPVAGSDVLMREARW